jgi:hypothetical protein
MLTYAGGAWIPTTTSSTNFFGTTSATSKTLFSKRNIQHTSPPLSPPSPHPCDTPPAPYQHASPSLSNPSSASVCERSASECESVSLHAGLQALHSALKYGKAARTPQRGDQSASRFSCNANCGLVEEEEESLEEEEGLEDAEAASDACEYSEREAALHALQRKWQRSQAASLCTLVDQRLAFLASFGRFQEEEHAHSAVDAPCPLNSSGRNSGKPRERERERERERVRITVFMRVNVNVCV